MSVDSIIPNDALLNVFEYFTKDPETLSRCSQVSKQWNICANAYLKAQDNLLIGQQQLNEIANRAPLYKYSKAVLIKTNFESGNPHVTQLEIENNEKKFKVLTPSGFIDSTRMVFLASNKTDDTEVYIYHTEEAKIESIGKIPAGARLSKVFGNLLVVFPSLNLGSQFYIKDLNKDEKFVAVSTKIETPFVGKIQARYSSPFLVFTEPEKADQIVVYNTKQSIVKTLKLNAGEKVTSIAVHGESLYALVKNKTVDQSLRKYNLLDLKEAPQEIPRKGANSIEFYNDKLHVLYNEYIVTFDESLGHIVTLSNLSAYDRVEFLENNKIAYTTPFGHAQAYQVSLMPDKTEKSKETTRSLKPFRVPNDLSMELNEGSLFLKGSKIVVRSSDSDMIRLFDFSRPSKTKSLLVPYTPAASAKRFNFRF